MLYKVSKKIASSIFGKDDKNLDEYIYGIELFFSSFVCTILLLILGVITNTIIESIIFILSFSALRVYTGGYHSNSFVLCNLFTLSIYVSIVAIYNFLFEYIVRLYISIPIFAVTLALILIFSPVENEHNPLEKTQYILYKTKASIVMIIETIICFVLLYILKFANVAIMIPTLFFVDVLIAVGLLKNKKGDKNGKE